MGVSGAGWPAHKGLTAPEPTEELPLVRIFLHLCLTPDGTSKPANNATSILVMKEFAARAVEHHYLFNPTDGAGKPALEVNKAILHHMKHFLYHNSWSASAHLQSLLCYGIQPLLKMPQAVSTSGGLSTVTGLYLEQRTLR